MSEEHSQAEADGQQAQAAAENAAAQQDATMERSEGVDLAEQVTDAESWEAAKEALRNPSLKVTEETDSHTEGGDASEEEGDSEEGAGEQGEATDTGEPDEGGDASDGDGEEEESGEDETDAEGDDTDEDDAAEDGNDDGQDESAREERRTARNYRLTVDEANDPVGAMAFNLKKQKAYKDRPMKELIAMAERALGVEEKTDDQQSGGDDAGTQNLESAAELEAKINALWDERTVAFGEQLDFEKAAKLDREIRDAENALRAAREREIHAQQQEQQQWHARVERSKERAVELYPFVTDPNTAEAKRMVEIDRELKAAGDDLYYSPDKPLKLAQMAAREFNIAPRSKKPVTRSKPVPRSPTPQNRPGIRPASPTARTNQNQQSGAEQAVDKIRDEEDYHALVRGRRLIG